MVTNWNDAELIWSHIFEEDLRIDSNETCVLLMDVPLNPKKSRERMMKTMFEKFKVLGFYLGISSVFALYGCGKCTGIIVDSGGGVTHSVPVYEGHSLSHSIMRMNIAGRDITSNLCKILSERGYEMTTSKEREILKDLKEKLCNVSMDFNSELTMSEETGHCEKEYELPDGEKMTIGSERFRSVEVLFKPALIGSEVGGIHEITNSSILKTDFDLQKTLYENVVLSGGSSLFSNFNERFKKEISNLTHKRIINVHAPEGRLTSSWKGGKAISSLSTFSDLKITKEQYKEFGTSILHRKFF